MVIVWLIGMTGALGCLALGLGMFVLGKPPPFRPAAQQGSVSLGERLSICDATIEALQEGTYVKRQ